MEVPMAVAAPEQSECRGGQRIHDSPMTKAKQSTCGLTNELLSNQTVFFFFFICP